MKRLDWKYLPIAGLFLASTMVAPVFRAQNSGSITRIRTIPDGAWYKVDGTTYTTATAAIWPAGSKHMLDAVTPQNPSTRAKTQYRWKQWEFGENVIRINPVPVTAAGAVAEYVARFEVYYALTLNFSACPEPNNCDSSGRIYINDSLVVSNQEVYYQEGAQLTLQAFPNPGYVFIGWQAGDNQVITGLQNKIIMNGPVSVRPIFRYARKIIFNTEPPELQILADHSIIKTPAILDWGYNTTHTVGPVTPQADRNNKLWVFSSWSDNGAPNHIYEVDERGPADTLVATFIPAARVAVVTQPPGLKLLIDGAPNTLTPRNPTNFAWGVGETHRVEAPAQQTDAQGRVWRFSGWSNGGTIAQNVTVPLDADLTGGMLLTATYTQLAKLTITSPVALTVDGAECASPCEILREIGQQVSVAAPPSVAQGDDTRLDFEGFPGGGSEYVVTMTAQAQTLNATYKPMNRLRSLSDPAEGASWRVEPASGDGFYPTEAVVLVSVSARPGYKFRRWDGDLSGTIPSGVVTMSSPRAVRAMLDPVPYIAPAGVTNAAGATPSASVAPGSVVTISGANLANGTASAGDGLLPQTLAGMTARVGDRLLPLLLASPEQINAVLPDDLELGQRVMTVSPAGQAEVRTSFDTARNAPGLFDKVFHEDGSAVTPDAPASTGELLTVYGTGFGPADHPRLQGFPTPSAPEYLIVDPVEVRVGDTAVTVVKTYVVPGKIGIDAVSFRIPEGTPSGPVKVVINGVESNTVTVALQ